MHELVRAFEGQGSIGLAGEFQPKAFVGEEGRTRLWAAHEWLPHSRAANARFTRSASSVHTTPDSR